MSHRGQRQVEEVYTIKQVTAMTGVPENTIRSWERRFGVPTPGRTGGNQRTYSKADIRVIESLQASRMRGRTMEQAILDLRASGELDSDSQEPVSVAQPSPEPHQAAPDIVSKLAEAIERLDAGCASMILADELWVSSIEEVCFNVLLRLDEMLPEREAEGRLTRVQRMFGQDWIGRKLHSAFDASRPDEGRLCVVVAAMQDSEARRQSLCYAITMSRAGYRVHWGGGNLATADIGELVARLDPMAVLLVARSNLSKVTLRASLDDLNQKRDSGGWSGLVMISGAEDSSHTFAIPLESNTKQIVDRFEEGLRSNAANLRILKSE